MAIERAAGTADDTLDATSATLIAGLTLTPPANNYFLFSTVGHTPVAEDEANNFEVYVGGSVVSASRRIYTEDNSLDAGEYCVPLSCKVSTNGSQAVEIRHHVVGSGSLSGTAKKRELNLFPISGTDVENTGTVDDVITSDTFVAVDDMTMTTPDAGAYLLAFSSSLKMSDGLSGAEIRVTVGGVEIAHTIRRDQGESSDPDVFRPISIFCEVNPDGTEDVVIEWRRSAGSATLTMSDRTMNLIPTASGDIFEASATADDTDVTTDDKRIEGLIIDNPGADDYLTMFGGYDSAPTMDITYSMQEGGALVTDSERPHLIDSSIQSVDRPKVAGGRVTVGGATDDIEMFWQSDSTSSRLIGHRTLVALREATVSGRIMSSLAQYGGLAGFGGIAGRGGGLAA